jgi:hypothetical protein
VFKVRKQTVMSGKRNHAKTGLKILKTGLEILQHIMQALFWKVALSLQAIWLSMLRAGSLKLHLGSKIKGSQSQGRSVSTPTLPLQVALWLCLVTGAKIKTR